MRAQVITTTLITKKLPKSGTNYNNVQCIKFH